LSDLIRIQTFPAIWSGCTQDEEVLLRVLHLDFAGVRVNDSNGGSPIEASRLPLDPDPDVYVVKLRSKLRYFQSQWVKRFCG